MEEVRKLSDLQSKPGASALELLKAVEWERNVQAQTLSFAIAERGLLILLEKSDFGKQKISTDECFAVSKIMLDYLRHGELWGRWGGHWLGGNTGRMAESGDREKWAACLIIGCSLLKVNDMVYTALNMVANKGAYRNSAAFIYNLSSQDDRLLSVLLAMLLKKKVYMMEDAFRPTVSCLHAFAGIDFEYEVLLDWLNSDLVSLPFLTHCVKDMTERFDLWAKEAEYVQRMRESAEEMSFMPGTWVEEEAEEREGDLVLHLSEIEGELPVEKKMRLSRVEPKRTWVPSQPEVYNEPLMQKVYDMFVRLRLRLEAIEEKGLGNYTALVKLLEEFEEKYEGANEEQTGASGEPPIEEEEKDKENNLPQ